MTGTKKYLNPYYPSTISLNRFNSSMTYTHTTPRYSETCDPSIIPKDAMVWHPTPSIYHSRVLDEVMYKASSLVSLIHCIYTVYKPGHSITFTFFCKVFTIDLLLVSLWLNTIMLIGWSGRKSSAYWRTQKDIKVVMSKTCIFLVHSCCFTSQEWLSVSVSGLSPHHPSVHQAEIFFWHHQV